MNPTIRYPIKGMETVERSMVARAQEKEGKEHRGFGGLETILHGTGMEDPS